MVDYLYIHRFAPIKLHMNFIEGQLTFHRFFLDLWTDSSTVENSQHISQRNCLFRLITWSYLRPHFLLETLNMSKARSTSITTTLPFWEIAASMTPLLFMRWAVETEHPRTKTNPNVPYTNPLLLKEIATGLTSPLPPLLHPEFKTFQKIRECSLE